MYVNLGRYKQEQNLDDSSGRKSQYLQARVRMHADHNAGKLYLQKGFAMQFMLTYGGMSLRELIHLRYAHSCVKKEASGKKQDKQAPTKHHTVSLSTMFTEKRNAMKTKGCRSCFHREGTASRENRTDALTRNI